MSISFVEDPLWPQLLKISFPRDEQNPVAMVDRDGVLIDCYHNVIEHQHARGFRDLLDGSAIPRR